MKGRTENKEKHGMEKPYMEKNKNKIAWKGLCSFYLGDRC
jgi:hypothetical protein